METIYLNTRTVVRREAPIIDLNEYRRKLERQHALDIPKEEPAYDQVEVSAPPRACRRPEHLGELMDVIASAAMVLAALVAAVAVLQ